MTPGSILLALALLAGVGFYIAMPLLLPRTRRLQDVHSDRRQALLDEKAELLSRLRALEFDWETGKIPDEVYEKQRTSWTARAAEILRELDATSTTAPRLASLDQEIESAVAQRRGAPATETAPVLVAAAASDVSRAVARFCPNCGQNILSEDRFCAYCGHKLAT
jgi:NADH pyrophosphatase NudC (nudix superfamily)